MRYNRIENTDLDISVMTLGTWVFGGKLWGSHNEKECIDGLHAALEMGVNCIDTAPIYGNGESERIVGKALKGRRDKVIIATKCGLLPSGAGIAHDLTKGNIQKEVEASLKRLGTEHIDLYQCHWPDENTAPKETFTALNDLKKTGKIRYVGVSNYAPRLIEEAATFCPILTCQDHYSLLERSIERKLLPYTREKGMGILAYGPLAGGILSGKYKEQPRFKDADVRQFFYKYYEGERFNDVQRLLKHLKTLGKPLNQIAINWVAQQKGVISVLVGCRNVQQVKDNAPAADWLLSDQQLSDVTQWADKISWSISKN